MDFIQQLAPIAIDHGVRYAKEKLASPSTELADAAAADNAAAVRSMLSKNPSINRGPALVSAAALGYLRILDILLEPRKYSSHDRNYDHSRHDTPDVNVWAQGTTPLLIAAKNHHAKTARLLLDAGADPDLAYKDGTTALHIAAQCGDRNVVEVLLDGGANVNQQNDVGDTPLIVASRWGHANTARYMIQEGAKVNVRNNKDSTALLVAARHDCVDVLQVLLRNGANINAIDKKGRGVLHRAVAGMWLIEGVPVKVKEQIVKMLLEAGADPAVRDAQGKTASDRAGWFVGGEQLRKMLESKRVYGPRDRHRARTF